jgi:hypothetical protein
MSVRFCPTCRTDVEDTGGFCLLGHSLRVAPATEIDELRADVDRAFATARAELAQINGRTARLPEPPAPPAAYTAPVVPAPATAVPAAAAAFDKAAPALSTAAAQPVPPPPPITEVSTGTDTVWSDFGDELAQAESPSPSDPISMFAPSPRMDWGPDRPMLRRPSRFRRPSSASV